MIMTSSRLTLKLSVWLLLIPLADRQTDRNWIIITLNITIEVKV